MIKSNDIKIKPIGSIGNIRDVFAFFKGEFLMMTQKEASVFLPLHEIYQSMVENLERKKPIQFYARFITQSVGCIIGSPDRHNKTELFLPVLAVDRRLRGEGIASNLVRIMQKAAKKAGFKKIKVASSYASAGFFAKAGFLPYLLVETFEPHTTEDIKKVNVHNLEIAQENLEQNSVKFALKEVDAQIEKPFRKLKDAKIELIYEKQI